MTSPTYQCPCTTITKLDEIAKFFKEKNKSNAKYLLIGSRALQLHVSHVSSIVNQDTDWDIMTNSMDGLSFFFDKLYAEKDLLTSGHMHVLCETKSIYLHLNTVYKQSIEIEYNPSSCKLIEEIHRNDENSIKFPIQTKIILQISTLEELEMIKTSHIYWPHHWAKSIIALHMMRRLLSGQKHAILNCDNVSYPTKVPFRSKEHENWIKLRREETKIKHGEPAKNICLNVTNEEFLNRPGSLYVQKYCDHDDIHEKVKFGAVPKYTLLKPPGKENSAMCDRKLFFNLPFEEQIQDVQEEGMVLALERFLLPGLLTDQQEAYHIAISRICTTITKGWFREFAIDHYPEVWRCPKDLTAITREIKTKYEKECHEKEEKQVILQKTEFEKLNNHILTKIKRNGEFQIFLNEKSKTDNQTTTVHINNTSHFNKRDCGYTRSWCIEITIENQCEINYSLWMSNTDSDSDDNATLSCQIKIYIIISFV